MPVQNQIRYKAFVVIGDYNGHVGFCGKCSKEVVTAIQGAKLSKTPVGEVTEGTRTAHTTQSDRLL